MKLGIPHHSSPTLWKELMLAMGGGLFFSALLIVALRMPILIAAGVAAVFSAALLLSLDFILLIYSLGFFSVIVAGLIEYYAKIDQVYWVCYALAAILFGRYFAFHTSLKTFSGHGKKQKVPGFILIYLAACLSMVVSTIVTPPKIDTLFVALKIYMPFFLILFVISKISDMEKFIGNLDRFFLYLPFLQMPFVLHQHFKIFRANGNWDAVVGTFGGNPEGGGASAVFMLFTVVSLLVAVRMFTSNRLGLFGCLAVCAACFTNILMGEVKAFIFLMPLALFVQEWRLIVRRPFLGMLIVITALWGVYFVNDFYYSNYLTAGYYREIGIWASILDTSSINYSTGEIGRLASIVFWWANSGDILERLIGYGAASTRVQSVIALGELGEKFYPLNLGATTVSQLLWESGIVGVSLYFLALIGAFFKAFRLSAPTKETQFSGRMRTLSALFAIVIPFCFYNNSTIDQPAVQLLLATSLALVWRYREDGKISTHIVTVNDTWKA